ncbi:MAG: MerR family transcriptional regulator [Bryobacteraceae bacterium]
MRIGQIAKRAQVSADTIRHYERLGLLPNPQRTSAGYRMYDEAAVGRVRLIQNALRFGFSLKQVGTFLGVRRAGGVPCRNVRAAGALVLEAIESQILDLTASRDSIKETLAKWDQRLLETPEGQPAHLLEALPLTDTPPRGSQITGRRTGQHG